MKNKNIQNPIGKHIIPLGVLLFLFPLLITSAVSRVAPANASIENINLCYDSSNSTDAIFQLGLFVPNSNYQAGVELQVNDIVKGNWQYTYFSGNGEAEVTSLAITPGNANAILSSASVPDPINQTISMPEAGKYTVLAHGSGENQPIQYSVLQEDVSSITVSKAKIRVVHISDFDSDLNNLTLDIRLENSSDVLINDLEYGGQGYFEVDPGQVRLQAVDQTGQLVIFDINEFSISDGELVTLFLYGNDADSMDVWTMIDCINTYRANQLVNRPQLPSEVGELRFVNLAPLSNNLAETELRFSLNGDGVSRTLGYGETSEYVTVVAQNYSIQVGLPDSGLVSDQISLNLESGQDYTVVASGGGSLGAPLKLVALTDTGEPAGPGQTQVRVGNFLSDSVEPSQINFLSTNDVIQVNGLDSLAISDPAFGTYAAGEYEFNVISGPRTLIDLQPVTFASGSTETLLVAGNGTDQPLGVYRISGRNDGEFLPVDSSRLYIAHLAPFADSVPETAISLEIDGVPISDFSVYGDSTGYLTLSSGFHSVAIKSNGTTVAAQDVDLLASSDYTMLFIGSESTLSLTPAILDNGSQPTDESYHVRLGNAAPFVQSGSFAAIDMADGSGVLQSNIPFGALGPDYISKAAGELDIAISLTGESEIVINPVSASFSDGDIVTLIATGGDSALESSVFVIENGQKGYFLDTDSQSARLYFANLMSLSTNLEDTAVAVKVDGVTVLQGVLFGQSTNGYIEVAAGSVQVEIVPSGSINPLVSQVVTMEADESYQFIAHGSIGSPASTFRATPSAPTDGTVRLYAGNMTPAGAAFYSGVEILQNEATIAENLNNGTLATSFVDVSVEPSTFKVLSNDNLVTLLETQSVNISPDSVVTLLLAGDGGVTQPAGLYAIVNDESMILLPTGESSGNDKPKLTISHFSPFATGAASSVIVKVNGQIIDSDFQYGEVLNQITGELGSNSVEIVDPTTNEAIKISNSPYLQANENYFYFVTGGVNGLDLKIIGLSEMEALSNTDATITVLNLINIQRTITDRRINMILSGEGDYSVDNLRYTVSDTVQVPAGTYNPLILSPDGIREYANPSSVTYNQGDAIMLVVTGDGLNAEVAAYQFQLTQSGLNVVRILNGDIDPTTFTNIIYLPIAAR